MFKNTTRVVAVGSVDGILTTAALLRLVGNDDAVEVCFTQAFTVNKIDPAVWPAGRRVAFVDLAVNNRDKAMTADFVRRVREAGHEIVAVIDEHSREDWLEVLGVTPNVGCYHTVEEADEWNVQKHDALISTCTSCMSNALPPEFDGLVVEPQSQNAADDAPKSSGEVLRRALAAAEVEVDSHTLELLAAADAGDRMDFSSHFGGLVNQSVKSAIADDSRRVYLARHLAKNREADSTIQGWIVEYEEILGNHQEILEAKGDLGDGIVRVVATGKAVDMTTLMSALYQGGARVVALEGEAFVPAKKCKEVLVAFGTADRGLDLMAVVRAGGITPLGGFAQKVNVALEDEVATLAAIRAALS